MDRGKSGAASWISSTVGARGEARDVLGDRAREQPVVLQHAADLGAILAQARSPESAIRAAAIVPLLRPQQAGEYLEQGRLARARWSDDRDALAGRDIEIEVRDDLGLVVAVAEIDIPARSAQDPPLRQRSTGRSAGVARASRARPARCRRSARRASTAWQFGTACREALPIALGELVLVGEERHQHADRQRISHHRVRTDDDDQDAIDPEQHGAQRREDQIDPRTRTSALTRSLR